MSTLLPVLSPNHAASTKPRASLFFLHGLGGDQKLTWTARPDAFWPSWLAEMFFDISVFSVGYEASPSAWLGSTMPISDRAMQLLALFEARRLLRGPMIFVVHSLGGLVVKEMIRIAETYQNKAWQIVARQTLGVVFLATPHSGSRIPNYLSSLGRMLRLSVSVRELEANAAPLRDLNLWYRNNARRLAIQTRVFFETRQTNGVRIVDEASADLGIEGVFPIPVEADHITICKLDTRDTLVFSSVANFVRELTSRRQEPAAAKRKGKATITLVGNASSPKPPLFNGKMPNVGTLLLGRDNELKWLDGVWERHATGVAGIIAFGGIGKTTLAWNWWLRLHKSFPEVHHHEWSFYNQGTTEGSQGDAEAFFAAAFDQWFKVERPRSRWAQGALLAECVRKSSMVLILDGLEPLQHSQDPQFGYFYDERMIAFLQGLASEAGNSLCICTSRVPLINLQNYGEAGYSQRDLRNLTADYGGQLLKWFKIKGSDEELQSASNVFGNHALTLTLVAKYIVEYYTDRDINKIDSIPPLEMLPIAEEGGHARRILRHYESVFPSSTVEHAILRCIGLFDRPVQPEALAALRRLPVVEGLTDCLSGLPRDDYISALRKLNRLKLVEYDRPGGPLDCHPIVRSHFAELIRSNPLAWREANRRLYLYYTAMAIEEQPSSRQGMAPLYPAVIHACRARAYAEAWRIYWHRIQQGYPKFFNTNVLGAFHEGLSSLASFYAPPWDALAEGVKDILARDEYRQLLTEVGFHLKVLGRFPDAKKAIREAMEAYAEDSDYASAAINSENLAETDLLNGDLSEALTTLQLGRDGKTYSDLSPIPFRSMQTLALRGQILFSMGRYRDAEQALCKAEVIRIEHYPRRQPVRSLYILDLLGELGRYEEVVAIADRFRPLLDEETAQPFTGAFYLFVGQAYAFRVIRDGVSLESEEALRLLDAAIRLLDASNLPHLQTKAPCIRARLLVHLGEYARARHDLDKALNIAEYARLKLYEVDCYLGRCELNLAMGEVAAAKGNLEKVRPFIVDGGYARPRKWMDAMETQVIGKPSWASPGVPWLASER